MTRESSPESSPMESCDKAEDLVGTKDGAKLKEVLVSSFNVLFLSEPISVISLVLIGDILEALVFLALVKFPIGLTLSLFDCCDALVGFL